MNLIADIAELVEQNHNSNDNYEKESGFKMIYINR